MNILLTGAFGNIGFMTLHALLDARHHVRCFDLKTPANLKSKRSLLKEVHSDQERLSRCEFVWGDICDTALLDQVTKDIDAVIHLAAVVPPVSENNPELSQKVNVQATQDLLRAVIRNSKRARFIFASTVGVYGYQEENSSPKTSEDPVRPVNLYGRQKVACEDLIRNSGLRWLILRLGVCFDSKFALQASLDTIRMQFDVRPEIRVEQVHPKDVAIALSNAVTASNVDNKILLIGGGEQCRTTSAGLIQCIFDVVGIKLPMDIYGNNNFYTEWIDTVESQRLLKYQRHTLPETVEELSNKLWLVYYLLLPFRAVVPTVFKWILRPGLIAGK